MILYASLLWYLLTSKGVKVRIPAGGEIGVSEGALTTIHGEVHFRHIRCLLSSQFFA